MNIEYRGFLITLAIVFMAGCTTLADTQEARGSGTTLTFDRSYEPVWMAAVDAVNDTTLDVVSEDKEAGQILAQKEITAFSYGENVAVFVSQSEDDSSTDVEVVSRKAMATNVFAKNWEKDILARISEKLEGR